MEEYLQAMYLQLAESIKKKIIEGVYNEGDAIPSEREIAKMYDVNRMTVKRAIMQCVNDGYLYRIQGKGTFVCEGIKLEAKGKIKKVAQKAYQAVFVLKAKRLRVKL
mgnify:CR=1 FL=1